MSNVIKSFYTVCENPGEKIVIDSNQRVAEKIDFIIREMQKNDIDPDGFSEGLNAERVELLVDEDTYDGEMGNIAGEAGGYAGDPRPSTRMSEEAAREAEEIISQAHAEAEAIISQAREEAEDIRIRAKEEGRREGVEIGREEGLEESENVKIEFAERAQQLEDEYNKKLEELEPMFVDTLTDIYEHVFHVRFADNKEIIFHLIQDAVRKVEGNTSFIIHVSKDDYGFVSMQKKELLSGTSNGESAEIVEDVTLKPNECLIETGFGIFDCSLETQLAGLKRELKLLSYKPNSIS